MAAKAIAIIGASNKMEKYSNKAVRAYMQAGYKVYPVNPIHEQIEGLKAYKSVLDIPGKLDLASLYVPASLGEKIIDAISKKGIKDVYVNPGAESDELIAKAKKLGLNPIMACSILAIGISPADF